MFLKNHISYAERLIRVKFCGKLGNPSKIMCEFFQIFSDYCVGIVANSNSGFR